MELTEKKMFSVELDGSKFWQYSEDGSVQEPVNFAAMDSLANGFKWGMLVRGTGQRKRHNKSIVTTSIYAMLDYVKVELSKDSNATVWCLTPDIEIEFKA